MKTVLYEERIKHKLMTFAEMRKMFLTYFSIEENENLDEEVKGIIDYRLVSNGGYIVQIDGDYILDWCNSTFDSIERSELLSKDERDYIIRDIYEEMRMNFIQEVSESGKFILSSEYRIRLEEKIRITLDIKGV